MNKLKQGDEVIVIAGKDKGKRGVVTRKLANNRILVEGVNMQKKHVKPNPNTGEQGGIVEREGSLNLSNVAVWNPTTQSGTRIGIKTLEDGKRVRYFKDNSEVVEA